MESSFLSSILSNKNTILASVLLALLGVVISFAVGSLFDNAILEVDKDWEKALKFTTENAEEFPYSVKTKQGNLHATGPVIAASPLVTHENINGEYMSIIENREEYRKHTEYYSCNCDDDGHCETCTRHYWSWDWVGSNRWAVEKISLLGQEMPANMINWQYGHHAINTKEGKRYIYTDSHHRQRYDVLNGPVEGSWGFTSDDNGFRYNADINGPRSGMLIALKVVTIILLLIGTGVGVYFFILTTYESYDEYI